MKLKKFILYFFIILIACICLIFTYFYFFKQDKTVNNTNENMEEFLLEHNLLNKELFESQNEFDLNSIGTDEMYNDEIQKSVENTIAEQKKISLEEYEFKTIYDNMPEEILGYIKNSFEDFNKSLKEYAYTNDFISANEAKYNYYRTINSGRTIMIYFILNDYYESEIGVLINLEDFSSNIFNEN